MEKTGTGIPQTAERAGMINQVKLLNKRQLRLHLTILTIGSLLKCLWLMNSSIVAFFVYSLRYVLLWFAAVAFDQSANIHLPPYIIS